MLTLICAAIILNKKIKTVRKFKYFIKSLVVNCIKINANKSHKCIFYFVFKEKKYAFVIFKIFKF